MVSIDAYVAAWIRQDAFAVYDLEPIDRDKVLDSLPLEYRKNMLIYWALSDGYSFEAIARRHGWKTSDVHSAAFRLMTTCFVDAKTGGLRRLHTPRRLQKRQELRTIIETYEQERSRILAGPVRPEHRALLEEALSLDDSWSQVAERHGITRERVRQIALQYGIKGRYVESVRNLAYLEARQRLADMFLQLTFARLRSERGEDYALAWRCREVFNWGKPYSLETLEKLITHRRSGHGYYACTLYAGIATTREEAVHTASVVQKILRVALYDVPHPRHHWKGGRVSDGVLYASK